MNLLLDTHVFLWFIDGDKRLKHAWVERIRDPDNTVFLSVVSLWEAIVKYDLGKLSLPARPEAYIPEQRNLHRIPAYCWMSPALKGWRIFLYCTAIHLTGCWFAKPWRMI